jgi:hypothetical protein
VAEARELARAAAAGEVAAATDVASQVSARYSVTALAGDVPAGAHRVIALPATETSPPGRFFTGRRAELAMLLTLRSSVSPRPGAVAR